ASVRALVSAMRGCGLLVFIAAWSEATRHSSWRPALNRHEMIFAALRLSEDRFPAGLDHIPTFRRFAAERRFLWSRQRGLDRDLRPALALHEKGANPCGQKARTKAHEERTASAARLRHRDSA